MPRQRTGSAGPARPAAVLAALVLLLALVAPRLGGAAPWSPPTAVYFPRTGHQLAGEFLSYWRGHGRATLLGDPITEQLVEGGLAVQYFERARLEYHPENAGDDRFSLSRLGSDAAAARAPLAARLQRLALAGLDSGTGEPIVDPFERLPSASFPDDPEDHRFFAETGHTLSNSFKLCWEANGDLAQFGYPLSEEFPEVSPTDGQVYMTQYFERARFEFHPETSANYSVVLTPLGVAAARARGVDTAPAARDAGVPDYAEALFRPPPTPTPPVARPGNIAPGRKWIDVNLTRQVLTAFDGDAVVWAGYMSSGRAEHSTPVGTFSIFAKLRTDDMRGPDPDLPGGRYFQPDVPYVMYFASGGYAIHGVYWHNNFGTPMSHGCVGLPVGAASIVYNWAPIGTLVYIHY